MKILTGSQEILLQISLFEYTFQHSPTL